MAIAACPQAPVLTPSRTRTLRGSTDTTLPPTRVRVAK